MATAIVVPQIKVDEAALAELALKSPTLLVQAREFTIENQDDYDGSLALIDIAIKGQGDVERFFEEPTSLAFQLHRSLTARVKFLVTPFIEVQNIIKAKRQSYRDEQERARRKKEQEDRDLARKAQEEQALKEAQELEKQGDHEAAAAVIEQAATAPSPAVVVPSTVVKQSGTILKKVWDFRIDTPERVPEAYKVIDESKIRKVVTALGDKHGIPGVTAFQKDQEGFRRK